MLELVFHKVHIWSKVLENLLKALAHIVQSYFTRLGCQETVLRAAAIAGK
jgi:hypothetical protein